MSCSLLFKRIAVILVHLANATTTLSTKLSTNYQQRFAKFKLPPFFYQCMHVAGGLFWIGGFIPTHVRAQDAARNLSSTYIN